MTLRDGGYDFEDGCPECGAGVRESYDERAGVTSYRCKDDECGWTATDEEESDDGDDDE